jgi:hypothetical protein
MLVFISGCFNTTAEFEVVSINVDGPVAVDKAFDVIAEIINNGGREGVYTAILKVDGVETDSQDITIPAKSNREVVFSVTSKELSIKTIEIGGVITVVEVLKPAKLYITHIEASDLYVLPGEEVIITAKARNIGDVKDTATVIIYVNGVEADTRELLLAPMETKDIVYSLPTDTPGNYEISVGGTLSQTIDVRVWDVETYHNKLHNFSILHPSDWEINEQADKVVMQKEDQVTFTITIESVRPGQNLEDLFKYDIEALSPQSPEYQLVWLEKVKVSDEGPEILRYRVQLTFIDSYGESIHRSLLFFKYKTNYYTFVLETPSELLKGNVGLYHTCTNSFRVLDTAVDD